MGAGEVHVISLNLQKCIAACANLTRDLAAATTPFCACLQEVYCYKGTPRHLPLNIQLFYAGENPRAAIIASREVDATPLYDWMDKDMAAIQLRTARGPLVMVSSYLDITWDTVVPEKLISLLRYCRQREI